MSNVQGFQLLLVIKTEYSLALFTHVTRLKFGSVSNNVWVENKSSIYACTCFNIGYGLSNGWSSFILTGRGHWGCSETPKGEAMTVTFPAPSVISTIAGTSPQVWITVAFWGSSNSDKTKESFSFIVSPP